MAYHPRNPQAPRACDRKRRYPDEVSATASALFAMEVEEEDPRTTLYVYKCRECRGWHITHKPHPNPDGVKREVKL